MIEFFTEPWNMVLSQWTLKQIISAIMQIGVIYFAAVIAINLWANKE